MAQLSFILVLLFGLFGSLFAMLWLWVILMTARGGTVVTGVVLLFVLQFVGISFWLAANIIRRSINLIRGRGRKVSD